MSPLKPFFHLTSAFFGLTYQYKEILLEEIFICTQALKNISYSDVMSMPINERRYYLELKAKYNKKDTNGQTSNDGGKKGRRSTRLNGDALKNAIKTNKIPLQ